MGFPAWAQDEKKAVGREFYWGAARCATPSPPQFMVPGKLKGGQAGVLQDVWRSLPQTGC